MLQNLLIALLPLTLLACSSSPELEREDPEPTHSTAADAFAATGQTERPAAPPSELPSDPSLVTDVDDDLLSRFADSLRALYELERQLEADENTYYHRVSEAQSPGDVQRIQQQYVAEKEDVVHEQGINFDDFLVLGQRIREDEELLQRLLDEVDARKVEEFFGI